MFSTLHQSRVMRALGAILWLSVMAGCLSQGQLGDRVWLDLNLNGIQDDGEPGVPGVVVALVTVSADGGEGEVATTVSNEEGEFFFDNLVEGDYLLEFRLPDVEEWGFSLQDEGDEETVDSDANPFTGRTAVFTFSGQANLDLDAGLRDLSEAEGPSIFGNAWQDANFNGIQDPDEPPEHDIEIVLFREVVDPVTGAVDFVEVHSTFTDAEGRYLFSNPPPGDYMLQGSLPAVEPYDITLLDAGNDAVDNDFDPITIATEVFQIGPGPATVHAIYDFGLVPLFEIGDFVWRDEQLNGLQDADEIGLEDINVILYGFDEDGNQVELERTLTDSDGFFEFDPQPPGFYFLEVMLPPELPGLTGEFEFTFQDAGNDDEVDSDVDRVFGTTDVFELGGDDDFSWDAGITEVSLGFSLTPDRPVTTSYRAPDAILPGDEVGFGPFNCDTGDLVSELGIDFTGFRVQQTAGFVHVTFFFHGPLGEVYSFAILPEFYSEADFSSAMSRFLFEYHDGQTETGMFDTEGGLLPVDQVDGLEIGADLEAGIVAFLIDKDLLPSVFDFFSPTLIATPTADAVRACLFFSLHDLTQQPSTTTNSDGDQDGPTESTPTGDFEENLEDFTVAGAFHQEDGELVVRYRAVDAAGNPVEGIGRATIAVGSPGGDRAEHGDDDFDADGNVEIRLPLDDFDEGEEVDIYIFFDGLSQAFRLGSFTVGE